MAMLPKPGKILVIDDSPNVAVLIQDFLKKLGHDNVQTCETGKAGIEAFESIIKNNMPPLVFLDYQLPDMNGNEVMKKMILLRPDVQIIMTTANQESEESIREIMRLGARAYLEKPIRLQKFKEMMNLLKEEEELLEGKPTDTDQRIKEILQEHTQLSLARIVEYCNTEINDATGMIKRLEAEGRIRSTGDLREASCNACGSLRIRQEFHCPYCKNANFKHGKLIEHFTCGNFSLEESYKDNVCPKCRKEIKVLGVDYKTIDNYYVCDNCDKRFPSLEQENVCLKCNNKFKIEQTKWATSRGYVVIRSQ